MKKKTINKRVFEKPAAYIHKVMVIKKTCFNDTLPFFILKATPVKKNFNSTGIKRNVTLY
jgi:hypothetical protein